jgi:hypothetical protein
MRDHFLQDFRYPARTLRRAPGFAVIALEALIGSAGAVTVARL